LLATLGHEADVQHGTRLGANIYLTKPVSRGALKEAATRLVFEKLAKAGDGPRNGD
jgi:DNA-binding response OmpR family regulator